MRSAEYISFYYHIRHSQDLVKYLIMRGINIKDYIATGFWWIKPIAPNFLEKDES